VDVEVEEADLGVGDPRERLAVDAYQLEEGDEREARLQRRGDVGEELEVVLGDRVVLGGGEPDGAPQAPEQPRLEPGQLGGLSSVCVSPRGGKEVLHEAVGEPPGLRRLADLVERVATLAQPRDDAAWASAPASSGRPGAAPALASPAAEGGRVRRRARARPRRESPLGR
jgi:hypothetical protein